MSRKILIVGNWKMHMSASETRAFIQDLTLKIKGMTSSVYLAPPFTSIEAGARAAKGSSLLIGAQNMSPFLQGAYTGEISSRMLKEAGACFVILGHSERRQIFKEDHELIALKVKAAIEAELKPIVCIGETEEERVAHQTKQVLDQQLWEALKALTSDQLKKIILAYEPVWAIGTGKTATAEVAQETHLLCRTFLLEKWGREVAQNIPILYGGSVKPENIKELIQKPDIDGALIGGASLKVDSFAQIIHNVEDTLK